MTITIRPRWSLGRGKTLVPSRWQATRTLTAFYGAIEDQEYSDACEMIEPELRRALVAVSGPCSIMIAEEWGDLRDVEVDESAITTTGDVARVPAGAIISGGKPVDDEGLTLARINDEWYISGGG